MKEGDNNWGHTFDSGTNVADPAEINKIVNQQLDNMKGVGRSVSRAASYRVGQEGKSNTNFAGFTVDGNDPIHGYINPNDSEALRKARKKLEEEETEWQRRRGVQQFMTPEHSVKEFAAEEEPKIVTREEIKEEPEGEAKITTREEIKEEPEGEVKEIAKDFAEQDEKLAEVFRKGMEIRGRYKNPGSPRYRLLSVAAVKMETISQRGDSADKVSTINKEIEKVAKVAVGTEEMNDYSGDTVAGVQAYIVEDLIGDDADQVSIGTTQTIVNPNGQVGKDPNIYKNLVVLRWIKNSTNHVFVFSPRKDAAMYALVDDSMGDSWKKTFLMAGAVNGDERREIMSVNHDPSGDNYLHEKTLERMIVKMMKEKEEQAVNTEGMNFEDKAKTLLSISKEYDRLAHLTGRTIKAVSPSEAADRSKSIMAQIRSSQEEGTA